MILKRRSDLTARAIDGEAVILDRATGQVHRLNATASAVWDLLDGARTADDIVSRIAADFDAVPDGVAADVQSVLETFQRLGLVETTDQEAPSS